MSNTYLVAIFSLIAFVVLILGVAIFLLAQLILSTKKARGQLSLKAVKGSDKKRSADLVEPDIFERVFCESHKDAPAAGECAICGKNFCKDCLRSEEGLGFCKEHVKTYLTTEWVGIGDVYTTPNDEKAETHLYDLQSDLWSKDKLPSFISTSYKLNLQKDAIESLVKIFVPTREKDKILIKIDNYKHKNKKLKEAVV